MRVQHITRGFSFAFRVIIMITDGLTQEADRGDYEQSLQVSARARTTVYSMRTFADSTFAQVRIECRY